jgi:hypothetical protein
MDKKLKYFIFFFLAECKRDAFPGAELSHGSGLQLTIPPKQRSIRQQLSISLVSFKKKTSSDTEPTNFF